MNGRWRSLSEENVRRIVRLVEGKTTAVLRVELMSSLTIVGHTTCKVPVAGVDSFPPWVLWFTRDPERQVEVGETVRFEIYLYESQAVTQMQGRILQLPERTEVAQIPFTLSAKLSPAEVEEIIRREVAVRRRVDGRPLRRLPPGDRGRGRQRESHGYERILQWR